MPKAVRAIRGATTVDVDEAKQVAERVQELVAEMFAGNGVDQEDVISILFTATEDISSLYPATAARGLGLEDVPLMGAQELSVEGMLPRCIRVMAHVNTTLDRSQITHVYQHDARGLRTDLARKP
jgi:chorismate mutase